MTVNSKMQRKGDCNQEQTVTSRLITAGGSAAPARLAAPAASVGNEPEILSPSPFTPFNPGLAVSSQHRSPHHFFFPKRPAVLSTAQQTYI